MLSNSNPLDLLSRAEILFKQSQELTNLQQQKTKYENIRTELLRQWNEHRLSSPNTTPAGISNKFLQNNKDLNKAKETYKVALNVLKEARKDYQHKLETEHPSGDLIPKLLQKEVEFSENFLEVARQNFANQSEYDSVKQEIFALNIKKQDIDEALKTLTGQEEIIFSKKSEKLGKELEEAKKRLAILKKERQELTDAELYHETLIQFSKDNDVERTMKKLESRIAKKSEKFNFNFVEDADITNQSKLEIYKNLVRIFGTKKQNVQQTSSKFSTPETEQKEQKENFKSLTIPIPEDLSVDTSDEDT